MTGQNRLSAIYLDFSGAIWPILSQVSVQSSVSGIAEVVRHADINSWFQIVVRVDGLRVRI